jgi:hypothetical protein
LDGYFVTPLPMPVFLFDAGPLEFSLPYLDAGLDDAPV